MFELWMRTDTAGLPAVKTDPGRFFTLDDGADLLGVEVFENGQPLTISGTIKAWIIRSDGTSIKADGEKDGNKAWIVLPEEAYAVPGKLEVFLKIHNGDDITTLGGFQGTVYRSQTANII